MGPELRSAFAQQGLSLYQAVTLASIVEREAVVTDERPLIASVFLNRLAQDIKLDADPTVQYALGLPAGRHVVEAGPEPRGPAVRFALQHLPLRRTATHAHRQSGPGFSARRGFP